MMFMILVVRRRWFKPQSAPTCLARVYCATEGTLPLFCVLYIDLNPYLLSSPEGRSLLVEWLPIGSVMGSI